MNNKCLRVAALSAAALLFLLVSPARADSSVERNTDVIGTTPAGEYRGIPGMQDNEPSCALNPILWRNIICSWNASGGSDDLIGDTWVRISESSDAGKTFVNRYINGSALDPTTSIGQEFAADPIMFCWPGGCGAVVIASTRAAIGGAGGGVYMQLMPDTNTEVGFRHALATSLTTVFLSSATEFADKPYAIYMLDEDNPGTVDVSITVDTPAGGTEVLTRQWPRARIIVAFALGDPTADEIRILSTYTDNYGSSWSTPREVTERPFWDDDECDDDDDDSDDESCRRPAGLNQGINMSAMGNRVLYTYRVFEDSLNPSAIRGAISSDRGGFIGEPFDIVSPFCAYDVPTLPNATNGTVIAARTNAFAATSNNGNKYVMLYAERKPSSDGGCFTTFDQPTDSRIKARISSDGQNWSNAVDVAPNADHGFQFQPVIDCSLGICQGAWWDSRFDSERVTNYLQNVSTSPMRLDALNAFLNLPVLGDFNFSTGPTTVIQFRRTARAMTTKLDVDGALPFPTETPPVVVSRYRRALVNGAVREVQRDGWNIKAYKSSTVPFMGDYSWLTSIKQRLEFDPLLPTITPVWRDNSSVDPRNPDKDPLFWMSFVTSRNVKGDIYTARIADPVPYNRTPDGAAMAAAEPESAEKSSDAAAETQTGERSANALEDFNTGAGFCAPAANPGPGVILDALNNRTKDFDIFGALIENEATAFSLNPTKTFNIQRSYIIVAENASAVAKSYRLEIVNQPVGFPNVARASWDQLPFDPAAPDFASTPPVTNEFLDVGPRSSESTAVFVVSFEQVNLVAVDVFEVAADGSETLINTITVNGVVEDGVFLNADGSPNNFEIHNPLVYFPDEFNPDEFNPDEYNPDEFNPDVYTPDEFNPDEFNPDEFNPDEFNPDEFNPDEFNPDEFNSPLTDPGRLENPEIPQPDLRSIAGPVAKLDINWGIQNIGNTTTPYTVDFAVSDPEVLALLASGELVTQLIAWQDKRIDDVQFCAPRIISENRILAAVNNPDLTVLQIPDINNNRLGALTFSIAPGDIVQLTLRFIAPRSTLVPIAGKLSSVNISSAFSSQVANTGSTSLFVDEELIVSNRAPATFNRTDGDTVTFEATGPGGATLPANLVTADRDGVAAAVACVPALGTQVALDIDNVPAGPTPLACTATTDNGVTSELGLFISVLDRAPPTIDAATIPVNIVGEAATPAGGTASYVLPSASDADGVDPNVLVECDPPPGAIFPFTAPGPTSTTVTCTATDDSFNEDVATFPVVIQDTTAPVLSLLGAATVSVEVGDAYVDPGVSVTDAADAAPAVTVDASNVDATTIGTYTVLYDAVDASGNNAVQLTRTVNVVDTSAPIIDGLSPPTLAPPLNRFVLADDAATFQIFWGPFEVTDAGSPPVVSCDVGVLDPSQSDPANGIYTFVNEFPVGTTTVTCTARDANNNTATASFDITIFDETAPVITLIGSATIEIEVGSGPYVDPGATVDDNADPNVTVDIDDSAVDTDTTGTYSVIISATDASGNRAELTRTVNVVGYPGSTGIQPKKLNIKSGSSNPLEWAWLDELGNAVDSSGDTQLLRIENCDTLQVLLSIAGDPGTSGFRFMADNFWRFNWEANVPKGTFCAVVRSSLTGQEQSSPPIRVR